jgi:TonB-linked SusC/RagA family outer membrane protein
MYKKIAEFNFRNQHRLLQKILLRMKLTIVILTVAFLQVQASSYAQKITLSLRNAKLSEVVKQLRKQTDYNFLYNSIAVEKLAPINLEVHDEELATVLDKCFAGQPLTFRIQNRTVLISSKLISESKEQTASQADIEVSGAVSDDKGPLVGVIVQLKGTQRSVATNAEGKYRISVPDNGAILVYRFIGYQNQEVAVGSSQLINIVMQSQETSLDDVVVVGYGTQRQKDVTGSVAAISSEDFNQGAQLAPQQLLQGKIAGVNIAQNSGKPGASNTVRIRGGTSLTGSNDPLYVIDGVPISTTANVNQSNIRGSGTDVFDQEPANPLQTFNSNDIESITVLKDASSTAIYGSRGANGVIVITTKKGKAGRAQVVYNGQSSVATVSNKLDILNADGYRGLVNNLGLSLDDKGTSTNWQDEIYRTAISQDHNISLSGGNEKTLYRASLGYGNMEGIMLGSKLEQANISANINHNALNDRLKFDLRLNYGQNMQNSAPVSNTVGSEAGTSMNYEAYVFNPTYPVRDANGAYFHVPPFRINPVSFSTDVLDQKTQQRLLGNLTTNYKIIDPLSIDVTLGYTRQSIDRNSYISRNNPLGTGFGGYASVQKLFDYSKLFETLLRFNKTYGKHSIDAIGGYSYQYFVNDGLRNTASGFLSDEFKWYSLQAASVVNSITTYRESNTLMSVYGRFNYNFDNRFLVTGTVRRDGSTRFGSGNKWGLFPSGSLAWRISEEDFFKVKAISDLKFRLSYGVTGNQEIGNLNSLTTLGASSTGYIVGGQRVTVVLPQQYANPDLKWEQTAQVNAGLNFGLFGDRIRGTFDVYRKKTTDLLLLVAVPSPSVVNTQLANVGSVENKGIEFELGATVVDKEKFKWDLDFNISRNVNKVLSLSNDKYQGNNIQIAPLQGTVSGGFAQLIMPDYPLGTFFGRKYTGLDANGLEQYEPENQVIGNAQPSFTYGLSNTFTYQSWYLTANLRGVVGNDVYNLTANNLAYKNNLPGRNVLASAVTDGVSRTQPKAYSSRWIENGSFLRLDNLTFGYNFKINSKSISAARLFFVGQNLFIITKYSGLDPEVNSEISASGIAPIGIDYLSYPKSRTFSLGASVSF